MRRYMARRVPFRGGGKQRLHAALDRHRDAIVWKLEGLSDVDLRRQMTPSGTSLLGVDICRELIDGMVGDHQRP
jgi:hypothetical protein